MPFHEKGDVRIRYEEAGSGFPLLVTPGGGLNSQVSTWRVAPIPAAERPQRGTVLKGSAPPFIRQEASPEEECH
jgi:hypothetical protein